MRRKALAKPEERYYNVYVMGGNMTEGQLSLVGSVEAMCVEKNISFRPMRSAEDIMNSDVKTLTMDHTVNACLKFMKAYRIRHVPIIDLPMEWEEGKKPSFIGVISERDVLRLGSTDAPKGGQQQWDKKALRQLLSQIVARSPKSASPQSPVPNVITTMIDNHIDMVPVLADANIVGVITSTDILKLFIRLDRAICELCPELRKKSSPVDMASAVSGQKAALFSWSLKTVEGIMTRDVICLQIENNLGSAMAAMQEGGFRHIPVVDEEMNLVGIVSDRDVLRHLPFGGKRPLLPGKKFREHLFSTDQKNASLELSLDSIMTRKVEYISPGCSANEAVGILRKTKVSCLPVVDERRKILGIMTVTNLMRLLLAAYEPTETVE
ncbi:MAG: CBS domain-containing protein [Planctomycetota bacterium]|jgi:acetoin utilization protein AcuB